jgi:hypothetical protein
MMSGKRKTLIDAFTTDRYGVFPMTAGSTWCGDWTERRDRERELLQEEEKKSEREAEEFAKLHPGALHRAIP